VGSPQQAHVEKFSLKDVSEDELHINISEDEFVKLSLEKDLSYVSAHVQDLSEERIYYGEGKVLYISPYAFKPPPVNLLRCVRLLI
jgi:hypothetical protein